jgi:hypothetical protein
VDGAKARESKAHGGTAFENVFVEDKAISQMQKRGKDSRQVLYAEEAATRKIKVPMPMAS